MTDDVAKIAADEWCDHCESHCPPHGYWRCPVCDAEWPDDDDDPSVRAHLKGQDHD